MVEVEEILKGVIYSKFEDIGPTAISWYPELNPTTLRLVSLKSITLLTGEEGKVPESFATIPFVNIGRTGLVKYFEIKDSQARGGCRDSSVTMLFDDRYNSILYKYMDKLNNALNEFSKKIIDLERYKKQAQFQQALNEFYLEILNLLKDLQKSEEREQFPTQEIITPKAKYRFKIIVVGDPMVGKTTLILRFVDRAFKKLYVPTIGVQVSSKSVVLEEYNTIVELVVWDIAGQEKFDTMRRLFYDGADGVIFVYDVTDKQSFINVANWFKDVSRHLQRDWVGIILANKIDLRYSRVIGKQAGEVIARKTGLSYLETSAKSGENIDDLFEMIAKKVLALS